MPSYEGPAFSFKSQAPTISGAYFWSIGHYAWNTFKATDNHVVIALRIPGNRGSTAAGTLRVGIQAVTGVPMNSLPDGTWLAYEDISASTYTTTMASKWITFTTPYTLTKNTFYAIVAQAQSGTFSAGANEFFCGYVTTSYTAGARFFPTAGRQAASNSVGLGDYVFGYRTSTQAYYGVTMPISDDTGTNVEMGARFVVPSGQYTSIECLGVRTKANGLAQQTIRLYDSSNNVIASATPKFDNTVGRSIYDTYWDTAVNLTAGATYYWGVVCPSTTQGSTQISVDAVNDWLADTSWQFAKARRTTPVTGAWTITTTENYEHQLILGNAITSAPPYIPTERNAGVITIAPGSTSQSIELYLGVTGLTSSSSGLSARYNRTRTASVDIPLVARTIAQAWTAGGFAEVDSTNMPGVYRLDVPDAALAAGADDVTIVVRGASGTNGAVMTVKLSSGGLTAAQTASAVWDEPYASHTTAATFGSRTLKTVADNRLVNVGTANHIEANVHAVVDSTAAASELSGALLHNGTDYISADLLTPVSAATSVHIGPYQLLADGLGADQPLDVNVGTATSIDVQVTDANGTGIDITGATVSAKVYNSGGTLVATYAGTATYADNGRLTFGLTTTVTATSGTYTVTVTRTTGATDVQIFGPLRLYVRPV